MLKNRFKNHVKTPG